MCLAFRQHLQGTMGVGVNKQVGRNPVTGEEANLPPLEI
jgi:hypothetical protein